VRLDVLVRSGADPDETWADGEIDPAPAVVVTTEGARGGHWLITSTGATGRWAAEPLPGPVFDAYGCGDSFAAALAYALGTGRTLEDALPFAATRGAAALCRPGAHGLI
jgi:ribokinase